MLSLYIHIPFCVRKCPYCGFYSTDYVSGKADDFLAALNREAEERCSEFSSRRFQNVYIGGGTPSSLSERQAWTVCKVINNNFQLSSDVEFTVEANPHTDSGDLFRVWNEGGANRVSLGVQSFSDSVLRRLGRVHSASEALNAYRSARTAGFRNISMDLMFGIPGQTLAEWRETLESAINLRPEHLSVYGLTLDEGSRFFRLAESGSFSLPDEELVTTMYDDAAGLLAEAGYRRYEISNFALPGYECRHNANYWERGEYVGLGPAAASFCSGRRFSNVADADEYGKRIACGTSCISGDERPDRKEASREAIMLSLRTAKGLDLDQYCAEYGYRFLTRIVQKMTPLIEAGLVQMQGNTVTLTDRGILLSNETFVRLSE